MNFVRIFAFAAIILTVNACKKDDDKSSTPENKWTVGSDTYTPIDVVSNRNVLIATSKSSTITNSISFGFYGSTLPTSNGTFAISNVADSAHQVVVYASSSTSTGGYYGTSGNVTVTVNGGKVTVDLPSTRAVHVGGGRADSVTISAHLTQQ